MEYLSVEIASLLGLAFLIIRLEACFDRRVESIADKKMKIHNLEKKPLYQRVQNIEERQTEFSERLVLAIEKMSTSMEKISDKLDGVDNKISTLDNRLARVETRIDFEK